MVRQLGGRKFVFALVAVILGFFLVLTDKVASADYLTFLNIVGATYVIGNVGEYVAEKMK